MNLQKTLLLCELFSVVKDTAVETAEVKSAVTFKGTTAHVQNS